MSQVDNSEKSQRREASPRTILQLFKKLPDFATKQDVFRLLQKHMDEEIQAEQAREEAAKVKRQRIAELQAMMAEQNIDYRELAPSTPAGKLRKPRTSRKRKDTSVPDAGSPDLPPAAQA